MTWETINRTAHSASRVCSLSDNMDNLIITGLGVVGYALNPEKHTAHGVIPN